MSSGVLVSADLKDLSTYPGLSVIFAFITSQGVAPLRHSHVASNWSRCAKLLNQAGMGGQLSLTVVLHQRDLMRFFKPINQQFGDARYETFMALDNDIHAE